MTWATPTTNTDGTPLALADISHFNFYCGIDPNDMSLNARLARTITTWTVSGLTCNTHGIAVTCVSRSGVESYQCTREVDVVGGATPRAPTGLTAQDTGGLLLQWPAVTQFEDGSPITVPVEYLLYRDVNPGVTPDEVFLIATTTGGTTSYADNLPGGCATYYYVVSARICCSEGAVSPECTVDRPSPPQCPVALDGQPTEVSGELALTWTNPTLRDNLVVLPSSEISATYVYYDTIPGSTVHESMITGNGTSAVLTGLTGCKTYYVHARTVDQCGHESSGSCMGNEVSVALAEPCDPSIPSPAAGLAVSPLDNRIDLLWNANQSDCDLAGYRVYYGTAPGVYTGTGAAEGTSPITLLRDAVTQGSLCEMGLTGLEGCTTYYVAVTCYDRCSPAHESPLSQEAYGMTTCVACQIQAGCPSWVSTSAGANKDVHLEVYTESSSDETLARLVPTWTGGARATQVLYGRPLAQIWNSDGTAGQDGAVGPQSSGATLNITDVTVPSWSSFPDGQPLVLVLDGDVRDVPFNLVFKNPQGGFCSANGTNRGAAVFDDFDDGNITGWTVRSGAWSSNSGELYQSNLTSNRTLIGSNILSDVTYEAKIKITSGTAAYLVFRYTDDNNFYTAGIISSTDVVRLSRMRSGSYTTTGSYSVALSNGQWYNLKVVLSGKRARVYLGCQQVLDVTDNNMNASGKIGFRTGASAARWDDARCQSAAILP
jgi:hypothetical protein